MAASAGTLVLTGMKSWRVYSVDLYIPDATGTFLTFNPSGLAASTSPDTYRVPEDCVLIDVTTAAAPTAVGGTLNVNSGVVNGGTFRWADRLNTLSNRAKFAVPIRGGDFISVKQH
jgi:hypothetical protein